MSFKKVLRFVSLLTLIAVIGIGCSGSSGKNGAPGANGANGALGLSTGNMTGTVVDSVSQTPVSGATVALNPAVASNMSTDTNGKFSFSNIPIGPYQVVVSASGYNQLTSGLISVVAGVTATTQLMIVHGPYQAPLIGWPATYTSDALDVGLYNVGYGSTVNISANVSDPNYPASALTYTWTVTPYPQYIGGETQISAPNSASLTFTTDPMMASINSNITPDQGRDSIIPIGPHQVGLYRIELYVTNPKGVQATSVIMVRSASKTTSIANVPVGVPEYMNFTETTPTFSFGKPAGSSAALSTVVATPPTTVVMFTPDVSGIYYVTETTSGSSISIVAGTWWGVGASQGGGLYSNCSGCHTGGLTGNFLPWSQSPHASMFTNGINGLLGDGMVGPSGYEPIDAPPYDNAPINQTTNEVCLSCHTLGYDQAPLAVNNGFDDEMKTLGWSFPSVLQASNWTNMEAQYPTLTAMANIQCENCHGPSHSLAHTYMNLPADMGPRIGWGAGVCYQCHDSEGPDWVVSPHAYLALAMSEATVQNRGTTAAHCGRCHSSQGFNEYMGEIGSGLNNGTQNIFNWESGSTLTASLVGIGLTVSEVQPQTCQMCHDGHSAANAHNLKLIGSTFTLAAGFTATNVGMGAICMECHNTRNGLHNESVPLTYASMFPHTPSQSDILMGQNAYFCGITGTTTIYVSKHANIADTCATCHMTLNPNNPGGAVTSHVWTINPGDQGAICANCHGSGVTGDGLQTEVQGLLNTVHAAILNDASNVINASASPVYFGSQVPTLPVTVTAFSGYGTANLAITDHNGTVYPSVAINTITTGTSAYVFPIDGSNVTSTTVVESIWNYSLVNSDGSLGIHNPTYILTILNNTLNRLQ